MITVDDSSGCCTLTLNRPDKANALTEDMLAALRDAVLGTTAHVLILTGAGQVFSAGADLDAARAGLATSPVWEELSGAIAAYPGLTLAALNGTCAGGAMGMILASDLRVAVPTAKFFYPVMKLGFLPQPSDPGRLARLVGPSRAKQVLLAGQRIDAPTALQWGLLDAVAEDPISTTKMLAQDALSAQPDHVSAIKSCF